MGFKALTVNTAAEAAGHIYAEDDAAIFQSMFGGDGVLNIGNCLKSTVISNNKVRISDGVLSVGGHIGRLSHADYQDMTIENGATGYNRNDIIYARFLTSGNVDSFILAVKKGTATTGTASDPALVQGNLYEGAVERDYPLYRVKLSGLSIASVDQLFTVIPTIPDLKAQMAKDKAEINQSLTSLNKGIGKKLDNAYANNANVGKGIKFGKNSDSSFFTFRPILSSNILQITKNDAISLVSIDTNGNIDISGEINSPTLKKMAEQMNFCKGSDRLLTDILNINFKDSNNESNYYGVVGTEDASTLINSPVTSGAFYAYREVLTIKSPRQNYKTIIRLTEAYPAPGRIWINAYNPDSSSWSGWKCNQGNTFIDVSTILKSSTTIAAGATATYTATRDCFVNVSVYAHGSGQNTKIYINNVCIFSPYMNNGSNAGLMMVQETVPLKTGQTIKIINGTYTTSDYTIFAAF